MFKKNYTKNDAKKRTRLCVLKTLHVKISSSQKSHKKSRMSCLQINHVQSSKILHATFLWGHLIHCHTEGKWNFATNSDLSVQTKNKVDRLNRPERHLNLHRIHDWHFWNTTPEILQHFSRNIQNSPWNTIRQTRGAVALRYFPSRRHRNDRLNIQQLILKKKPIFEKKKLSMEILMEEFKLI